MNPNQERRYGNKRKYSEGGEEEYSKDNRRSSHEPSNYHSRGGPTSNRRHTSGPGDQDQQFKRNRTSYGSYRRSSAGYHNRGGPHVEESSEQYQFNRIHNIVVSLGDSSTLSESTFQSDMKQILTAVEKYLTNCPDQEHKIIQLILACAATLGLKNHIYAVFSSCLAQRRQSSSFGQVLIQNCLTMLQRDLDTFFSPSVESESNMEADASSETTKASETALDPKLFDSSRSSQLLRIRLLVRFLAELAVLNLVRAEDLAFYLDRLLSICVLPGSSVTSRTTDPFHVAAVQDYFARVVLETLLHTGKILVNQCEQAIHSVLSRCKEYMTLRGQHNHFQKWLTIHRLWSTSEEVDQIKVLYHMVDQLVLHDALDDQQKQLTNFQVSPAFITSMNNIDSSSPVTEPPLVPLTLPTIGCEIRQDDDHKTLFQPLYRILTSSGEGGDQVSDLMHRVSPVDQYICRTIYQDILTAFHPRMSETARQLISATRVLLTRVGQSSSSRDVDRGVKGPPKVQYLMMETLFLRMFQSFAENSRMMGDIPASFYEGVLTECTKTDATLVSPTIAIVIELMFCRLDLDLHQDDVTTEMIDPGVVDALTRCFSHFLSNFEFKWPWHRWSEAVLLDDEHRETDKEEEEPQRLFVSAVIERCCRLSYWEHIQQLLPPDFANQCLPPKPQCQVRFQTQTSGSSSPSVDNVMKLSDHTEEDKLYQEAFERIQSRVSSEELWTFCQTKMKDQELLMVEVITCALLSCGAATLSHLRMLIEKYLGVLQRLVSQEASSSAEAKGVMLSTIAQVWQTSPQHIAIILDFFMAQHLIELTHVIQYVFEPEGAAREQFSWPYIWHLLFQALERHFSNSDHEDKTTEEDSLLTKLFSSFQHVLMDHKSRCAEDGQRYRNLWFVTTLGRMKQCGRVFRHQLKAQDLEPVLDLDEEIKTILMDLKATMI